MAQDLPVVRIARPEDEAEVMDMCHRLWEENGLFSYSEDKVRSCLHRCFAAQGTIVGVIGERGALQASTCMAISDYYYTTDWHLAELWNYVEPASRRSRNEALIEFGKDCSEKMGIPFLTGIITNKQMAGKVRLYRRLLGYPTGAFFIHNAPWKAEPMVDHAELRTRLKEFAQKCHDGKVSSGVARKQLYPILREAVDAIGVEDNLWGNSKGGSAPAAHANGSG